MISDIPILCYAISHKEVIVTYAIAALLGLTAIILW